ncbi:MAG: hypothetical protein IKD46_08850 [Lentisphaeria bacterium]|nr:hypothetical protein [Lentisphaeria bacterium]
MKKIYLLPVVFCAVFFSAGCCISSATEQVNTGKKIKTAFYVDKGSRGGGVVHLARLLTYSPQVEMTMVNGQDLRDGKLKNFDVIVMPGGSSRLQMESMAPAGVEALRDFVKNGGAYIGICAGCHITLDRPNRARILPCKYDGDAVGAAGEVPVDLSKEGAAILDIPAGRYTVTYSLGPILREAQWQHGDCQTLAVYKGSIGPIDRPGKSFYNTPAMVYGNFGKGKVIATSFHPEYRIETYNIFSGCFHAVTGVKLTPQIPVKNFRPLRVLYHFAAAQKKDHPAMIREILALEKRPELGLQLGIKEELLAHSDLLILPDTHTSTWADFVTKKNDLRIKNFMDHGGKVLAVGDGWNKIPNHPNLTRIKKGDCAVKAALEIAK